MTCFKKLHVIPGGQLARSRFSRRRREPIFFKKAQGVRVCHGRSALHRLRAHGTHDLGSRSSAVIQAVQEVARTLEFAPDELETELARRVVALMPSIELCAS